MNRINILQQILTAKTFRIKKSIFQIKNRNANKNLLKNNNYIK